ncbi:MAG: hypothetical protein HC896_13225 [Bacteroidales bacterium]|nr:hypothetical protein [Bacteroidales bacterium]
MGHFMLVVMLGAGNGLKNGVLTGFSGYSTNSMELGTSVTTIPHKGFPRGRSFWITLNDIRGFVQQFRCN